VRYEDVEFQRISTEVLIACFTRCEDDWNREVVTYS
jgi:hypothetical protein